MPEPAPCSLKEKTLLLVTCWCLFVLLPAGCITLGPITVPTDRFDYNKVLAQSSEQQLILNLVRLRYAEPVQWVAVNSMISKYTAQAHAGWSQWFNNLNVFQSPFLRGAIGGVDATPNLQNTWDISAQYSDSPTITYAPVEGEEFSRRILTPVPLTVVLYLIEAGWPIDQVFECCVQRLNDVENGAPRGASTQPAYDSEQGSEFPDVARRFRLLQETGVMVLRLHMDKDTKQVFLVPNPKFAADEQRLALREKLGIRSDAARIRLVEAPCAGDEPDALCVQTRSLLRILQALSHGVEVPKAHVEAGTVTRAEDYVYDNCPSRWLSIHSSPLPSLEACVQVTYRGQWFYVRDADIPTKQTLGLLTYLYSLQATDATGKAPVITIPAGS
jgi:hypothetical protein